MRNNDGFKRFKIVLENLGIPHADLDNVDIENRLDDIFKEIFN